MRKLRFRVGRQVAGIFTFDLSSPTYPSNGDYKLSVVSLSHIWHTER